MTQRPTQYVPMSARDREAAKKAREEIARFEEQDRIERERPLRAAEEEYKRVSNELATLRRDVLLNDQDPAYTYGANPWDYATLPENVQRDLAVDEWKAFCASYQDFHPSRFNFEQLRAFLEANKCEMPVRTDWAYAYTKLSAAGILEDKPAPIRVVPESPKPKPNGYDENGKPRHYTVAEQEALDSDAFKRLIARYEQDHAPRTQSKSKPETMKGIDLETGLPKDYTPRQVASMSAEEYRRVFINTQEGLKDSDLLLCRKHW